MGAPPAEYHPARKFAAVGFSETLAGEVEPIGL